MSHRYVLRGIGVCDRWRDFVNFLADMGERPPGTSLDRVDNDVGYEQSNCRWVSRSDQNRNRTNNKLCAEDSARMLDLRANGCSYPEIGRYFGVSKTMARNVCLARAWA